MLALLLNLSTAIVLSSLLIAPLSGQGSSGRLDSAEAPRLLDCEQAGLAPCYRLKFNIIDAHGSPLPVALPASEQLRHALKIQIDGRDVDPFLVLAQNAAGTAVRGRIALILVDISGSMNVPLPSGQTRFEAAKAGIMQFLQEFQDGVDRVAVVPFESHNVDATIRQAQFVSTKEQALAQVNGLPAPASRNNTGLYSAVNTGMEVLAQNVRAVQGGGTPPEAMMVITTDGKNEVLKGDDAGLLTGPEGLEQIFRTRQLLGTQVIGIGFGDPRDVDQVSLARLSSKSYMATNSKDLKDIFSRTRTLLNTRISATFVSPWLDRASLASRTLHISARIQLPSGETIASDEIAWGTPKMGIPPFEGTCDSEELNALVQASNPGGPNWISIVRPICVFVGLAMLLIVLWFWVPRLVWPEQHTGALPPAARWASPTSGHSPGSPKGPPGFETRAGGAAPPRRAPSDPTVVSHDFTKTRLEKEK